MVVEKSKEDLTGRVFGNLTVLGLAKDKLRGQLMWDCICLCGGTKAVQRYHLTTGAVSSCGCKAKHSTKSFIEAAKAVHGDTYDYSKTKYTASQDFLTITCKLHGDFEQRATIHLTGSGCQVCAGIRMGAAHAVEEDVFLSKAKEFYGDRFDYSKMEYKILTSPIKIICREHQEEFMQPPNAHLAGVMSCKKCRGKMFNKEDFVKKAKEIHGEGAYDYSLVEYVASKKKVKLICKSGHVFEQTPHNHTAGKHGCPTCTACGFDPNKTSKLYVLTCGNLTKIGITNRSALIRSKNINRSSGLNFKVIGEFEVEGEYCLKLETALLKMFRKSHKNPTNPFDGFSETFIDLEAEDVVEMIECLI